MNAVRTCLVGGLLAFGFGTPMASADAGPERPVLEVVPCNDSTIQDCGEVPGRGGGGSSILDDAEERLKCTDHNGQQDLFLVEESPTLGENFRVWILQGARSKDVFIGWNTQIPRSKEGVNTYLSYRVPPGAGHDQPGGPVTENRAHSQAITGACGAYAGTPQGAMYDVGVDFMGQDVTVAYDNGTQIGTEVSVKLETKFSIRPTKLTEVRVSAEATGSFVFWTGTTTTLHGYLKKFGQDNYVN